MKNTEFGFFGKMIYEKEQEKSLRYLHVPHDTQFSALKVMEKDP